MSWTSGRRKGKWADIVDVHRAAHDHETFEVARVARQAFAVVEMYGAESDAFRFQDIRDEARLPRCTSW